MTRPIYGSQLIKTARLLAGRDAGRGRPAISDLRRATSTASYALFHDIVRHGSADFLPSGGEDEIAHVARWFTHRGVRDTAELVTTAVSPKRLDQIGKDRRGGVMAIRTSGNGSVPDRLQTVADAFQSLQDARHSADYDGNDDPVRAVTLNHVDQAEEALKAARWLWKGDQTTQTARQSENAAYRTFLRLALLRSGGPKSR